MILPAKLAIVDLETTGGNFLLDRIIEVGIIRVENGEVVQTYQSLVNPLCTLPEEIISFTGIHPEELETAPTFDQLATDIRKLITDCVFVAHNARFDYSFLRAEFRRLDHTFTAKNLCTVKLSRALFPQEPHHNLTSIIERYQLTCEHRHRALGDAQAVWDFLQHVVKSFPAPDIHQAVKSVFKRPAKPSQISDALLDSLPDGPGVYIFYGDKKLPLYIGKSRDIRSRVFDHFSDSVSSPKKLALCQQVQDIEAIETAGELAALLLESSLIKKLQPLYNRALRSSQEMIIGTMDRSSQYHQLHLKNSQQIDYDTATTAYGVFRSRSQAKKILAEIKAKEKLCDRYLGLERTTKSCFSYGLGECKGACSGKEGALKYNLRQEMALIKLKIKTWPFPGPVAIVEANFFTGKQAVQIFDLWSHLGTFSSLEEWEKNEAISEVKPFDLDTYHILRRFLRDSAKSLHIHLLKPTTSLTS